jgi:hypothetical protein
MQAARHGRGADKGGREGKMGTRDDFGADVKDVLAKRVGMRCSNPNCRQPTSGPQKDLKKVVNVGVAAHISAASSKGPRYDPALSPEERRSLENGIWLCQNCAKLVDNDPSRYPPEFLRQWKRLSEQAARLQLESPAAGGAQVGDVDLMRFFAQCFDRPAFQDPFQPEGSTRLSKTRSRLSIPAASGRATALFSRRRRARRTS